MHRVAGVRHRTDIFIKNYTFTFINYYLLNTMGLKGYFLIETEDLAAGYGGTQRGGKGPEGGILFNYQYIPGFFWNRARACS